VIAGYHIASHAQQPPDDRRLAALASLCFGSYPGVLRPSLGFVRWFLRRPGLAPALSQAAWHGDELVASLFVTEAVLSVGLSPCRVGLVDTVMTAPEHRGQGLASALIKRAIDAAASLGLEAMLLYTSPDTGPYRLYASLGFRHVKSLDYWRRPPGACSGGEPCAWEALLSPEPEDLAAEYEQLMLSHDGVPVHDARLWRWRKRQRPASIRPTLWRVRGQGAPAMATCARLRLTGEGSSLLLSDVLVSEPACLQALCARMPPDIPLITVADTNDSQMRTALELAGFRPGAQEAMLSYCLDSGGAIAALSASKRPWLPLTESIIGI